MVSHQRNYTSLRYMCGLIIMMEVISVMSEYHKISAKIVVVVVVFFFLLFGM